jgi:hypothetical protein
MTAMEKSADHPGAKELPASREETLHLILGRIDLVAILTSFLSVCVLGFLAAALAIVQFAELISSLWSDPLDRWLVVAFGLAVVWVAARRKNLCVF